MNNRQRIAFALALTLVLTGAVAIPATAQTIDAGRGPVPLTVPTGYDADVPMPLIVSLHGYSSSGQRHDSRWGIGALADRYGFLTISPDGTREAQGDRNPYWNASSACCNFERTDIDDSAYLRRMIDQIRASYNVDPSRIYVIGHSNGGFMSYRVAYEHSDAVAAIVSLAGANHLEQREPPPHPVHVPQIHGTDDTTFAYRGGDIQGNRYPGAFASVSRWAQYNGCDGSVASREVRDLDASLPGHETGVMKINAGCKDGGSAEQIVEWLLAHSKPAHLLD
jgi:polyhydroxybutyrate depolymerase